MEMSEFKFWGCGGSRVLMVGLWVSRVLTSELVGLGISSLDV